MQGTPTERSNKLSFRVPYDKVAEDIEGGANLKYGRPILRGIRPGRLLRKHAWAPGVAFGAACMLLLLYYIHRDQKAALISIQLPENTVGKPLTISNNIWDPKLFTCRLHY
jgi:hypothetical protein